MLEVVETLSEMLSGRILVSEEELRRKAIRAGLKALGVKMKNFSEVELNEVVSSFIECPLSVKSAYFSEKVYVNGITFYHLHTKKPDRREFEIAYSEFLKSKTYLDNLKPVMNSADKFFSEYTKEGYFLRFYTLTNEFAVFFSTISDLFEDVSTHLRLASQINGEYVVLVQTEEKPDDFVKFFKLHSEEFKRVNAKVWVANPKNETIDPFIGYPKDIKLLTRFKNPKIAGKISALWREKVEELD